MHYGWIIIAYMLFVFRNVFVALRYTKMKLLLRRIGKSIVHVYSCLMNLLNFKMFYIFDMKNIYRQCINCILLSRHSKMIKQVMKNFSKKLTWYSNYVSPLYILFLFLHDNLLTTSFLFFMATHYNLFILFLAMNF